MKKQLINKLYSYLVQNQVDLLISLQEDHRLNHYLDYKVGSVTELYESLQSENRPAYVIEALCMEELTRDLRPSRFEYMRALLVAEFGVDFKRMSDQGILTYEIISLIGACEPIFDVFGFGEDREERRELRYAIMGMISEYLER